MQFCCYFYCKCFQIWRHLMSHDNFFWRFCIRSTYKRMGLLCIRLINKNKYYHLTTWKFCDNISISTWEKKKDYFSSMANASNFMQMCQYFFGVDEKSRMCPFVKRNLKCGGIIEELGNMFGRWYGFTWGRYRDHSERRVSFQKG